MPTTFREPRSGHRIPPEYAVHVTREPALVEAAQRLRYEVFNRELREGLADSHATGLDRDAFDAACDHVIIREARTGEVVGTYRLQTGAMAAASGLGFYGEQEFDFGPFATLSPSLLELGRACVHREHRSLGVIGRLWRAIADYAQQRDVRYLVGCSSLTSQDPALGAAMTIRLRAHLAPPALRTHPRPDFALPPAPAFGESPPPPRLLRAYLALGAKVCGPPALDRAFGTIDFLTIMDCHTLRAAVATHFLAARGAGA